MVKNKSYQSHSLKVFLYDLWKLNRNIAQEMFLLLDLLLLNKDSISVNINTSFLLSKIIMVYLETGMKVKYLMTESFSTKLKFHSMTLLEGLRRDLVPVDNNSILFTKQIDLGYLGILGQFLKMQQQFYMQHTATFIL